MRVTTPVPAFSGNKPVVQKKDGLTFSGTTESRPGRSTGVQRAGAIGVLATLLGLALPSTAWAAPTKADDPTTPPTSTPHGGGGTPFIDGVRFTYYAPLNEAGPKADPEQFQAVEGNDYFTSARQKVTEHLRQRFENNPDLLDRLEKIPGGLEIRLYQTDKFVDETTHNSYDGFLMYNKGGEQIIPGNTVIYVAADQALNQIDHPDDTAAGDAVMHNLGYILDLMDDMDNPNDMKASFDGLFPNMSDKDKKAFIAEREKAKQEILATQFPANASPKNMRKMIQDGQASPLARMSANPAETHYAAQNSPEFLAMLSETYFTMPKELKARYPELYRITDEFMNRKPKLTQHGDGPSEPSSSSGEAGRPGQQEGDQPSGSTVPGSATGQQGPGADGQRPAVTAYVVKPGEDSHPVATPTSPGTTDPTTSAAPPTSTSSSDTTSPTTSSSSSTPPTSENPAPAAPSTTSEAAPPVTTEKKDPPPTHDSQDLKPTQAHVPAQPPAAAPAHPPAAAPVPAPAQPPHDGVAPTPDHPGPSTSTGAVATPATPAGPLPGHTPATPDASATPQAEDGSMVLPLAAGGVLALMAGAGFALRHSRRKAGNQPGPMPPASGGDGDTRPTNAFTPRRYEPKLYTHDPYPPTEPLPPLFFPPDAAQPDAVQNEAPADDEGPMIRMRAPGAGQDIPADDTPTVEMKLPDLTGKVEAEPAEGDAADSPEASAASDAEATGSTAPADASSPEEAPAEATDTETDDAADADAQAADGKSTDKDSPN